MDALEREKAYTEKLKREGMKWAEHSKDLKPLAIGQDVLIQCQTIKDSGKWNRSGRVISQEDRSSYMVRIDGSGRMGRRNRIHLRPMKGSSVMQEREILAQIRSKILPEKRRENQEAPPARSEGGGHHTPQHE